jgi:RNA polymerase sigma-70 factor (ECF subfamily)
MDRGYNERELIRLVQSGSKDATEVVVGRYLPGAYRAAYFITGDRQMAEDVVQDSFERVLRSIDDFDAGRPFGPWLHRIVSNRAVDLRRARRAGVPFDEATASGRDPYEDADTSDELARALAALTADRRVVVVLRLLFGYSPAEVARILDVEVGTVHSRLSRGMSQLREHLEVSDPV